MKEKRRYLKIKVEGVEGGEEQARKAVNSALFEYLGQSGFSKAKPQAIKFVPPYLILRCRNDQLDEVVAALSLKRFHEGKSVALRTEKVSGTIAALTGKGARRTKCQGENLARLSPGA
ncbi:hypothetical protein HZC09_04400 [Candidatus Micrarchaeota archaeon]|nr:hypothetical protein [Candidatus Micrarchaeota archaeon]